MIYQSNGLTPKRNKLEIKNKLKKMCLSRYYWPVTIKSVTGRIPGLTLEKKN